jgi:hypothetical protein
MRRSSFPLASPAASSGSAQFPLDVGAASQTELDNLEYQVGSACGLSTMQHHTPAACVRPLAAELLDQQAVLVVCVRPHRVRAAVQRNPGVAGHADGAAGGGAEGAGPGGAAGGGAHGPACEQDAAA